MKKLTAGMLTLVAALSFCTPAFAAEDAQSESYTIMVNDQTLELGGLPVEPYEENGTVMVPFRMIGEALGYQVGWNAETQSVTVEDPYVQKATLHQGTAAVVFEGKLEIIDMSREVENDAPTVIYQGYTYVPLTFFREFFNDTNVEGATVAIAPSMAEICGAE